MTGSREVPSALVASRVVAVAFDQQVHLTLLDTAEADEGQGPRIDAELTVEAPFRLRDGSGVWHDLAPEEGSRLAPVLDLWLCTVTAVTLEEAGTTLVMDFDDGSRLRVGPDTDWGEDGWSIWGLGTSPDIRRRPD
ncbi:DUF6188 family protein [Streptomyces sp. NPDC006186]|uniref:DUF6188 family protein n=1 Tax=Streptomyces sp. NPDC006186 TaxID=3155248 RepID=UPI0033A45053